MKKQRKVLPKRLVVWAAKGMFKSAKKLAEALKPEVDRKVLVVRSDSLKYQHRLSDVVINWGNSKYANWKFEREVLNFPVNLLNLPEEVSIAINKLKTFQELKGEVSIPEWTTNPEEANIWLQDNCTVICRHILAGFGGIGITVATPDMQDELPPAPLYVLYKKKKKEFRVHVFNDKIIDITQKKKRTDYDEKVNTKIRNYANGWVYCREDIDIPDDVKEQAIKAVRTLGLNFGAVDIIWNEKEDKAYVLEVNTAPGLEGTTIEAYKNAILKEL